MVLVTLLLRVSVLVFLGWCDLLFCFVWFLFLFVCGFVGLLQRAGFGLILICLCLDCCLCFVLLGVFASFRFVWCFVILFAAWMIWFVCYLVVCLCAMSLRFDFVC